MCEKGAGFVQLTDVCVCDHNHQFVNSLHIGGCTVNMCISDKRRYDYENELNNIY